MKLHFLRRRKFWIWFTVVIILLPVVLFAGLIAIVYWKQDELIQQEIEALNKGHKGRVVVGDTHIAPFANFPYMSIKVDDVTIYETKEAGSPVILDVKDIYIGFSIWDIVNGKYDIQSMVVEDGFFNIVTHVDGTTNLENALATDDESQEESEPLSIHLKKIRLKNLDIHKFDESSGLDVETYIHSADGGFKTGDDQIRAHIDTRFVLNIIDNGDTTFIKHKHFEFHTDLIFDESKGLLQFEPSGIVMEHGEFELQGSLSTKGEKEVDIEVKGTKPNFDMLIAFAPEDLIPVLERYQNAGKIYFNAEITGPTAHGQMPFIDVRFGASDAYLENVGKGKRIDELGFNGHFSNGAERNMRTMVFELNDIHARPETGELLGSIRLENFEEPEVEMTIHADFNLEFLADFFNLSDIQDASGLVTLDMRFHDIIDIDHPEKALQELDRSYFSELTVKNLKVRSDALPANLERMDLHVKMEGKRAELDKCHIRLGGSDLSMTGYLSDLPAILHHTSTPVEAHLEVTSNKMDLAELTRIPGTDSSASKEEISDLRMFFSFRSSARDFTESKYLPKGEFFIDDLHAKLKNYPHELHDFHADFLIGERDLSIVDFTGFIDQSDFHFNGLIHDYGFWMQEKLEGDVDLDITLKADRLLLQDVFSYEGENYVPEDYRNEEFDKLVLHVNSAMHFRDSELHSIDLDLDRLDARMKFHPLRFEQFNGRIHYEDEHIVIENFHGKLGRSVFDVTMNYYLGDDEAIKKRDNYLKFKANYLDYDQLFNFDLPGASSSNTTEPVHHDEAFNIYTLPFTDMKFDVDIGHFIYHHIDLQQIHARLRTTKDHYLHVDSLRLLAAGGSFSMTGYFNGSDPEHIYLSPKLRVRNADIDRLMFKFDNFGQDELVSENLHGKLSADITGKIRMHPDMVPMMDDSEIHLDVEVLNGRLDNYEPVLALSEYFGDKDLTSIRFDTLKNHIDIKDGMMSVPNMTIESTLGHLDISGTHYMDDRIEYFVRIPWTVIKEAARNKLFGSKKTADGETGDDAIIEKDPKKNVKYLNLRIHGTVDEYKVGVKKPGRK